MPYLRRANCGARSFFWHKNPSVLCVFYIAKKLQHKSLPYEKGGFSSSKTANNKKYAKRTKKRSSSFGGTPLFDV